MYSFRCFRAGALSALIATASAVSAATVNLSTWTAQSYGSGGTWTVAPGGGSVFQSVNGDPTLFYSDFNAQGTTVSGKIKAANDGDDDFYGFVLGYQPGDNTNTSANYLLVDWKQGNQSFDFGAPSSSPGGLGKRGLAVSRVFGIPDLDEFWQHSNLSGTPVTSGLTELARGATLGDASWVDNVEYTFKFEFGPSNLRVYVDNVLQIDIAGTFADGRMGFYNFSQSSVTYTAFTVDSGPFPSVPDAGATALMLAGALGALLRVRHCRR